MHFSPRQKRELSDFLKDEFVKTKMDPSTYKKRDLLYAAFYQGRGSLVERLEENREIIARDDDHTRVLRYISYATGAAAVLSILLREPVVTVLLGSSAVALYLALPVIQHTQYRELMKENMKIKEKLKLLDSPETVLADIKVELERIKGEHSSGNLSSIELSGVYKEIRFINQYFRRKYILSG